MELCTWKQLACQITLLRLCSHVPSKDCHPQSEGSEATSFLAVPLGAAKSQLWASISILARRGQKVNRLFPDSNFAYPESRSMICCHLDFVSMVTGVAEHFHMGSQVPYLGFSVGVYAHFSVGFSILL